jgi:hypothetical protein
MDVLLRRSYYPRPENPGFVRNLPASNPGFVLFPHRTNRRFVHIPHRTNLRFVHTRDHLRGSSNRSTRSASVSL